MTKKHESRREDDAQEERMREEEARDAAGSAAPLEGAVSGASAAETEAELTRLRAREDELLRALAELQNIQRRRKQEMDAAARYASEALVRELLVVLDDFERALRAPAPPDDPFRAGVALVHDRLVKILEREGVEPIRPHGERFDPELHDAIAHLPIPGAEPGTVVEVAVPGYRYRDRVLRHAKVVVAAESVPDAASAEPRGGP